MSMRDGSEDVFVIRPDGTGARNLTRTPSLEESHPSWSPTGELTFTRHAETGPIGLWAVRARRPQGATAQNRRRAGLRVRLGSEVTRLAEPYSAVGA